MAGSMRDIKRRIRGIGSTRQITRAMEMVSTAKLKKAREDLERTRPYYNTVYNNIIETLGNIDHVNHPFLKKRKVEKTLYIVITADRGLAGGFNSNITKLLEGEAKDKKDSTHILTVGLKGWDYLRRRDYEIKGKFLGETENPTFADAKEIGKLVMEMYEKEEVDEVNIIYTNFVSTLSQSPRILKLLPCICVDDEVDGRSEMLEFEPSAGKVLDYLIPKYIEAVIFGTLIESSASQQAARMTAMQAATDNANEIIEDLELKYNRARQAAITAEISEIVTGAEALK